MGSKPCGHQGQGDKSVNLEMFRRDSFSDLLPMIYSKTFMNPIHFICHWLG